MTVLIAILFAALAALVSISAFRWGQQSGQLATPAPVSEVAPTLTKTAPPVVTNTPTPTALPTHTPTPTITPTFTPSPTATPTPTPTPTPIVVINHVAALGRLETTEFAMRTIVDLENEPGNFWESFTGTDRVSLVAEGEVVAGIDLGKVKPEDITVTGNRVSLILPAPEILYSRIDNERTYVYERETGLFQKIDPTLESRARQIAEQSLRDWATERNIHSKAATQAQLHLENLLRSLGFTDIVIKFRESPL